ncbi:MAG: hypothetical protein EOP25_04210 [Rhodococcus sp. (in: high G+C Gram-positive bacteria)]|nr:MAG: hypothetical protein EOP25_04210 [Rhodococcus sp. (in: high G+C Gram-positive bacteria)]
MTGSERPAHATDRRHVMHREALGRAALRGLKPGPPLQDPARLLRVAVGMIVAAIGGYLLHDFGEQVLICVGAFLGGIASLMPHNRSGLGAAVLTGTAEIFAAATGILLHGLWWLILPILFIGLLTAGILRGVALSSVAPLSRREDGSLISRTKTVVRDGRRFRAVVGRR